MLLDFEADGEDGDDDGAPNPTNGMRPLNVLPSLEQSLACSRMELLRDDTIPLYVGKKRESKYVEELDNRVDIENSNWQALDDLDDEVDDDEEDEGLGNVIEDETVPTGNDDEETDAQAVERHAASVATIEVLLEARGACTMFPKYLTKEIGNVHKDRVNLRPSQVIAETELGTVARERWTRTMVNLANQERAIHGVNVYMPHSRSAWLKKTHQYAIDQVSILPNLIENLLSPHNLYHPASHSYKEMYKEAGSIVENANVILKNILETHAKFDQLTVRQELTFADENFIEVELQWPFPEVEEIYAPQDNDAAANADADADADVPLNLLDIPILAHVYAADAVEMYSFLRKIILVCTTPLRKYLGTFPVAQNVLDYQDMSPIVKTALVYHAETIAYLLDCVGFKGVIHEAFAATQADCNLCRIPMWYVEALVRSEYQITMLDHGINACALKTIHSTRFQSMQSRSIRFMEKVRSNAMARVDFGPLYWRATQRIIQCLQSYVHAQQEYVHAQQEYLASADDDDDDDEPLFMVMSEAEYHHESSFFLPVNWEVLMSMEEEHKKKMFSNIGKIFFDMYDQVYLLKVNKLLRQKRANLLEAPIEHAGDLARLSPAQRAHIKIPTQEDACGMPANQAGVVTDKGTLSSCCPQSL
jgi:hypothetical protein